MRSNADLDSPFYSLVGATLKDAYEAEPDRKCFRLVGGVLVERTVKDVLPQLEGQTEQVSSLPSPSRSLLFADPGNGLESLDSCKTSCKL